MRATASYELAALTDGELLAGLGRLVASSNQVTANLLAHIGEVDARRLYLPAACNSMFAYCVRVLGLSEDATYKRIQAARAARRYPVIFALIASGRLHLAAVTLLAPHLGPSNHEELLNAATCLSKRDVERLIAHRFPSSVAPSFVRRCPCASVGLLPSAALGPSATEPQSGATAFGAGAQSGDAQLAPGQVDAARCEGVGPNDPSTALSGGSQPGSAGYKVQFTASEQLVDKMRAAQELLGHSVPPGDLAQVFERALDALLRDLRRHKFGYTDRPARGHQSDCSPGPRTRAIPAAVRRTVAARDRERCTFVDPVSGRRCDSRTNLQFHHLEPYALGGEHDPATLTLRCSAHNLYAARQDFGAELVDRRIAEARQRAPGTATDSMPDSPEQRGPREGEAGEGDRESGSHSPARSPPAPPGGTAELR
jgi:hypothetical protein